jgi:hypothetical protein
MDRLTSIAAFVMRCGKAAAKQANRRITTHGKPLMSVLQF